MNRVALCLAQTALITVGIAVAHSARAQASPASKKVAVGFTNLVARLENDAIGFAKAEYRVHILEALRASGYNAVGAENLVFGKDEAESADLLLGGTVKELACRSVSAHLRCSVGIEWQLLDRQQDKVVYRVLSRFVGLELPSDNPAVAGKQLVLGALRSLTQRPRVQTLLNAQQQATPDDASYPTASFTRCDVPSRKLPADFDAIAAGTVIVKAGDGTGSGFTISPDGLVMTAAHVASAGKLEVLTRDGKKRPARVVRISRKQDVALLSLDSAEPVHPCVPLEVAPEATGAEVYAIGAPGGEQLGFSLSRGIVSGLRTIGDVPLIQTDASLSPGNSGGPLLDSQGRVIGVVSRKIAGQAVEGLGFAVPIHAGLTALKLEPGTMTAGSLHPSPSAAAAPSDSVASPSDDTPDAPASLDPDGDRGRASAADYLRRVQEQKEHTPRYVPILRWMGLTIGCVGAMVGAATGLKSNDRLTRADYESRRLANDLGWTAALLGLGAFATSYALVPKLAPARAGAVPRFFVAAGPTDLKLNVSFQ